MTDKPKTPQVECPECEGTGRAELVNYRLKDGRLTVTKINCPECKGTGKVDEEVKDE